MSVSLALACLLAVAPNLLALRPVRGGDGWGLALVALGVPMLRPVAWQHGPLTGLYLCSVNGQTRMP